MKSIAVMQPYFFPYLGYYQLAHAVDSFVFMSDANFILRGYVNRNSILLNKAPHRFTLPVIKASQNREIRDHLYAPGCVAFLELLQKAYKNSPYLDDVYELVQGSLQKNQFNVAAVNAQSVKGVFAYLGIAKNWSESYQITPKTGLKGAHWIQELCKRSDATVYVNAPGGRDLYDSTLFADKSITLSFLEPSFPEYEQSTSQFHPGLSMIDVLMWNSPDRVFEMINSYKVVN